MSNKLQTDVYRRPRTDLGQAIGTHLRDLSRGRATAEDWRSAVDLLRRSLEEAERGMALQELNELLNELLNEVRERISKRKAGDTTLIMKGAIMKKAVAAGLDLETASGLYAKALKDGELQAAREQETKRQSKRQSKPLPK